MILEVENGEFYNQNITQPCRKRGQVKKHSAEPTVISLFCDRDKGGVSLLTVPLTGYRNGKIVNCLFLKTTINVKKAQCSPNCCFLKINN